VSSEAQFVPLGIPNNQWNGGRLKPRLYDKRDDFTFTIVNFPFIRSNIPA
jgi:hypothetical protein